MKTAGVIVTVMFGAYITYHVSGEFISALIVTTTYADMLITNMVPMALAAFAIVAIITIAFGWRRKRRMEG